MFAKSQFICFICDSYLLFRSGFKCIVKYCWPEHENHVCQVYSIESHGIQHGLHIMGGKLSIPYQNVFFGGTAIFPCVPIYVKTLTS